VTCMIARSRPSLPTALPGTGLPGRTKVACTSLFTLSSPPAHHPVFDHFERWKGPDEIDFDHNFLGVRTRFAFFLDKEQWQRRPRPSDPIHDPGYPGVDNEYFEWIDVLETVLDAKDRFTMVELGAGYGRWLSYGAAAARAIGLDYALVGLEAEPTHFRWLAEHLRDNSIPADRCTLVEAAVDSDDGWVDFWVGDSINWYGQRIESQTPTGRPGLRDRLVRTRDAVTRRRSLRRVRALSLRSVLAEFELIDLIDVDIQGAEVDVLTAAPEVLDAKVKRVHVGTHSVENEAALRRFFTELGWKNLNDYSCFSEVETPWGAVEFQDGVQTWINPRLSAVGDEPSITSRGLL
jgi:FkbM family methyltransferase